MIKRMALTRVFDAPVSVVWKYWTEPEKIMKWWGPVGFTTGCRMDFREGGTSLVSMRPSKYGHHLVYSIWAYKKIVPEKEIEFVMAFADRTAKSSILPHWACRLACRRKFVTQSLFEPSTAKRK